MIKLSANISKKLPIPNQEFSSQQFGASMEIEVSDADQPEIIHGRIRDIYALLSQSVDEQIAGAAQQETSALPALVRQQTVPQQRTFQQRPAYTNGSGRNRVATVTNGNGNGNGRRGVNATEAQCRAIFAICKSQGLNMVDLLADFNVSDPKDLHVKDASRLIHLLTNGSGTAAH